MNNKKIFKKNLSHKLFNHKAKINNSKNGEAFKKNKNIILIKQVRIKTDQKRKKRNNNKMHRFKRIFKYFLFYQIFNLIYNPLYLNFKKEAK